jgi:hypothetical protein
MLAYSVADHELSTVSVIGQRFLFWLRVMVFNATFQQYFSCIAYTTPELPFDQDGPFNFVGLWYFSTLNNISAISWQSVLLVEVTGVPAEKHGPVASHCHTLSHNVV